MPRSSAEVRRAFVHHIVEVEGVGQEEQQGDQRDDEEGEEVNGDVEEIRSNAHNKMTHGCAMWDECELEANAVCDHLNKEKQSRDADTNNKEERLQKQTSSAVVQVHSVHESLVDVLVGLHMLHVIQHVVGLVALCAELPIHWLSKHQSYSPLICTRIPCRHTAKMDV